MLTWVSSLALSTRLAATKCALVQGCSKAFFLRALCHFLFFLHLMRRMIIYCPFSPVVSRPKLPSYCSLPIWILHMTSQGLYVCLFFKLQIVPAPSTSSVDALPPSPRFPIRNSFPSHHFSGSFWVRFTIFLWIFGLVKLDCPFLCIFLFGFLTIQIQWLLTVVPPLKVASYCGIPWVLLQNSVAHY